MASKMKNIDHRKTSLFYLEDGFHPKKTSWSLGGTKPLMLVLSNFPAKTTRLPLTPSFNWSDLTIVLLSSIGGHYICNNCQVTLATLVQVMRKHWEEFSPNFLQVHNWEGPKSVAAVLHQELGVIRSLLGVQGAAGRGSEVGLIPKLHLRIGKTSPAYRENFTCVLRRRCFGGTVRSCSFTEGLKSFVLLPPVQLYLCSQFVVRKLR